MLVEPNRFKTFCIRIDSLAKQQQQQHSRSMHAYALLFCDNRCILVTC
jgi:hypothetical protein